MIDDFNEELLVRRVPKRFSRRPWEWQVWRTVERENTWGDIKTRRAVVAQGRSKTEADAQRVGTLALATKIATPEEPT